jgi:hypothetical protein
LIDELFWGPVQDSSGRSDFEHKYSLLAIHSWVIRPAMEETNGSLIILNETGNEPKQRGAFSATIETLHPAKKGSTVLS